MEFIDLKAQYSRLRTRINERIHSVLESGAYIMGSEVSELENQLSAYAGVKHCITCANGTDALQLALMARGVGPGDAVFTTPFTFFATAEVIALVGATPVFVDIDELTYNICPRQLEDAIEHCIKEGRLVPKAIIAVDLFGLPADYPALTLLAEKYRLTLIEDAAQGFGGRIGGKMAGSFGDVATTSFFPAKPLGCYGDGGAVFTNDDSMAELIRSLRVHGKGVDKYDNVRIGINSRLDTIQAAILLEKLAVFEEEVTLRNEVASRYHLALEDSFFVPHVPRGSLSSWAQYTVRPKIGDREQFMSALKAAGIPSAIYYAKSLHRQIAFSDLGDISMPVAEKVEAQVFSLPMHPYLSAKDSEKVITTLLAV